MVTETTTLYICDEQKHLMFSELATTAEHVEFHFKIQSLRLQALHNWIVKDLEKMIGLYFNTLLIVIWRL